MKSLRCFLHYYVTVLCLLKQNGVSHVLYYLLQGEINRSREHILAEIILSSVNTMENVKSEVLLLCKEPNNVNLV